MRRNKGFYIFFIALICTMKLQAQQEVARYPVRFSQYYNAFATINPAAGGAYSDYEFAIGSQQLLGNFSKVSSYYFNGNMRLPNNRGYRRTPFSVLGIYMYNDREGKYLNRSRFYATYAWHGNISRNLMMSGGFHIGGMNYSVKGTILSGSGSDTAPDGVIGFRVYNEAFHAGISYNQIFNTQIQPLEEVAKLPHFLNLTGGFSYYPHHSLVILPVYSIRIPLNGDRVLADMSVVFSHRSNVRVVIGVHNNDRFIASVEFRELLEYEKGLNVAFTYSFPLSNTGISTNFVEVGASFLLSR